MFLLSGSLEVKPLSNDVPVPSELPTSTQAKLHKPYLLKTVMDPLHIPWAVSKVRGLMALLHIPWAVSKVMAPLHIPWALSKIMAPHALTLGGE